MVLSSVVTKPKIDNVIELSMIDGKLGRKQDVKYNKDGSVDKRQNNNNKVAGVSSEVYAFNEEEIKNMIKLFDNRINNAPDENKRQIACRNKMMFVIGINLGIRASDLCGLQYNFFMNNDGSFKNYYSLQPKKTSKYKKIVKLYFNEALKKAISNYIEEYPIQDTNEYLFKSRKGDKHITEIALGKIIKDAAKEIGIEKNICSHSLRKTFGFWAWHNAKDKNKTLVTLQKIFNHSDTATTLKYIGILDSEIEDVFDSLDLGLDYI